MKLQLQSCLHTQDAAGEDKKIIRVMPNTPCLVGEVASAMCLGGRATEEDSKVVKTLFSAVGFCCVVDEKLLSAVTGLSGSGPAYVFVMIEAMADGGVKAGLPRDIAQQLAAQTVFGSAKMVLQTGKHPGQLKDMVTSPAGSFQPLLIVAACQQLLQVAWACYGQACIAPVQCTVANVSGSSTRLSA